MEVSIVIPTFNEQNNIVKLLEKIGKLATKCFAIEAIIVDDNSKDKTISNISNYAINSENDFFKIKLHQRLNKSGLSSAILDGIKLCTFKFVVVMDADLSHTPEIITKMINALQNSYDLVIGSRYVDGGKIENWPLKRKIISKGATAIAKIGLNIKQKDPMSGFFALDKRIINDINFDAIGYKLLLEILVKKKGIRIKEIPISFKDRDAGKSKLGYKAIIDFIVSVWKLYRYGKKIKEPRVPVKFVSKTGRFFTVGASGLLVNILTIISVIGIDPFGHITANLIGILVSMTSNFILNKRWTFEEKDFFKRNTLKQYGKFIIFSSGGAAIQLTLYNHFREFYEIPYYGDLIIAVLIAGFGNFILNKKFTFNEKIWS